MLTLERKDGESLVIYNDRHHIEVLVKIVNGKAKLSIKAPKDFNIGRKEQLETRDTSREIHQYENIC